MPYRASHPDALSEWLTDRQVAALLNISARTLPQWWYLGKFKDDLPHYKIGRSVRYRRVDVEAFVTRCRVGGITLPERSAICNAHPAPNYTDIPAVFSSHSVQTKETDK